MFTKPFKDIFKKDANIAGGKGASLGEMTNAGMPIPPGFVVLANTFDEFLKENDLEIEIKKAFEKINYKNINSVEKASAKINSLILMSVIPDNVLKDILKEFKKIKSPLVAVRSSATAEDSSIASWAGELETYLNVDEKNLIESIKECWASLFTPRAIFYAFEKGLYEQKNSVAVVIQKMVQSEISGIAFTVHPVTEDKKYMLVEAGYGLGEAIVGGEITPDSYVIDKKERLIVDKNISEQKMFIVRGAKGIKRSDVPTYKREVQKLSDKDILKLVDICLKIEKHYKKPQDIEWALEGNKIYITQSRPITTL
ncbi:MAG: PEP/pyruvate-binding domain-containing protein [Candidatus Paceibacterota bacterium]